VTIAVGCTPTPAGCAGKSDRPLVVVNISRGDALGDPAIAQPLAPRAA
jgi:hypothetical protein